MSLDESINFFDQLEVGGVEKSELTISSLNPDVLDGEDGVLKAKSSGSAYVLAKFQQAVIAQVKVHVKYKFSAPQNFIVSEGGVLSWNKSSLLEGSAIKYASKYKLSYALIEDNGEEEWTEVTTNSNSYQLPSEKGTYAISVQALSTTDLYDHSNETKQNVNYGVVGKLEQIRVNNEKSSSQATISWKHKPNAKYDVYVEGFLSHDNLESNSFNFNYSQYSLLNKIHLQVVAKSKTGDSSLNTTTDITLERVGKPSVSYSNGTISIAKVDHATTYVFQNKNDRSDVTEYASTNGIFLEGRNSDIYTFNVMSRGSQGSGYYINSEFSDELIVAKLPKPQYDFEMTTDSVKLTFTQAKFNGEDINVNYLVTYGGKTQTISTNEATISLSTAGDGKHQLSVQTLPKTGMTLSNGTLTTANVLKSDVTTFEVVKTEALQNITHNLTEGKSQVQMPKVKNISGYTAKYRLLINNDISITDYSMSSTSVVFNIEDLSTIEPVSDKYTFKIEAYYENAQGKIASTTSSKTKDLSILQCPTQATTQDNGYFKWNSVAGAEYRYKIYSADEFGNILSTTPVQIGETANVKNNTKLDVGYYKIKVYSLSKNTNAYLDCDFVDENRCLEAGFKVTQNIEAPQVAFIEGAPNKVEIILNQYAGAYDVFVDGKLDSEYTLVSEEWEEGKENKITITLNENVDIYHQGKSECWRTL